MHPDDYLAACGIILFTQDNNLYRELAEMLPEKSNLCCVSDPALLAELVVAPSFQVLICDTTDANPHGMSYMPMVRNISPIGLMALVAPGTSAQRIAAYRAGAESCVDRHASMFEIGAVLGSLCRRMLAAQNAINGPD
jgi:DNA-binding response OmpR family regulator